MSGRREWILVLMIGAALVVVRSIVFVAYEQSHFDSDQAIVGLMAKHLSEGRAFPLFFYGQSYMLGVEAWCAAPFLWIGGPTVASLRVAMVTLNLAAAWLLVSTLVRTTGMRPLLALTASLFFVIAPPFTSALLVEAQGGSIEPFIYLVVLWRLRNRPAWFGAVLAVGFLNREFTLYAVPVILLGQLIERRLWRPEVIRGWLLSAVTFFAVWDGINALKPYADLMGPGTRGQLLGGFAGSQLAEVSARTNASLVGLWPRLTTTISQLCARLLNGVPNVAVAAQGHAWLVGPMLIAGLALVLRAGWLVRRHGVASAQRASFCWYLAGTGMAAILVYSVAKIPADGTLRYLLLSLLVPIGLVGGLLAIEPKGAIRAGVAALAVAWGGIAAADNAAYIRHYAVAPEPDQMRELTQTLVARHIGVVEADYWHAYKLSFLSREQTVAASIDVVRIAEYQVRATAAADRLWRLQTVSCAGGERVGVFFLCHP